MGQHIKIPQTKIISKNGEVDISITIEPITIEVILNVNSDGNISVASTKALSKEEHKEESTSWAIPTFGSSQKIKFGK